MSFADGRPTLILNPPDDRDFGTFVRSMVEMVPGPEELEFRLRERYPRAIVRPRDLSGERMQVWYVYRDGHWIRPFGR
ncbi:MAG TPA: hypothetical protein VFJ71_01950 [Candidatus Limnocylindrales bacterium]|nr:hypothetical protein [Candidatus Limnocylindrales bacterium]